MSAKGPPPPAGTVDFESPDYDVFENTREAVVQDALEYLLASVNERIEAVFTERYLLATAVDSCLNSCLCAIDMMYVRRDESGMSSISISNNSWEPDVEPEPCGADAWLRCAVPALYPTNLPTAQPRLEHSASSRRARSITSRRSSMNSRARTPTSGYGDQYPIDNIAQQAANALKAVAAQQDDAPKAKPKNKPKAKDQKAAASPEPPKDDPAADHAKESLARLKSPEKLAPEPIQYDKKIRELRPGYYASQNPERVTADERLREELRVRRQQIAAAQEWQAKDDAARAEVIAMRNNLKGKGYAYNHKGELTVVHPMNPDALPHYSNVNMHFSTSEQAAPNALRALKNQVANLMALPGLGHKSAAASKEVQDKKKFAKNAFIELPNTAQPNLLDTMKPGLGTTLKYQNKTKKGPPVDVGSSYERMTKPQFQQLAVNLSKQPNAQLLTREQQAKKAAGVPVSGQGSKASITGEHSGLPAIHTGSRNSHGGSVPTSAQKEAVKLPPVKA